jgi:hypothetical protein
LIRRPATFDFDKICCLRHEFGSTFVVQCRFECAGSSERPTTGPTARPNVKSSKTRRKSQDSPQDLPQCQMLQIGQNCRRPTENSSGSAGCIAAHRRHSLLFILQLLDACFEFDQPLFKVHKHVSWVHAIANPVERNIGAGGLYRKLLQDTKAVEVESASTVAATLRVRV